MKYKFHFALLSPSYIAQMVNNCPCNVWIQVQIQMTTNLSKTWGGGGGAQSNRRCSIDHWRGQSHRRCSIDHWRGQSHRRCSIDHWRGQSHRRCSIDHWRGQSHRRCSIDHWRGQSHRRCSIDHWRGQSHRRCSIDHWRGQSHRRCSIDHWRGQSHRRCSIDHWRGQSHRRCSIDHWRGQSHRRCSIDHWRGQSHRRCSIDHWRGQSHRCSWRGAVPQMFHRPPRGLSSLVQVGRSVPQEMFHGPLSTGSAPVRHPSESPVRQHVCESFCHVLKPLLHSDISLCNSTKPSLWSTQPTQTKNSLSKISKRCLEPDNKEKWGDQAICSFCHSTYCLK